MDRRVKRWAAKVNLISSSTTTPLKKDEHHYKTPKSNCTSDYFARFPMVQDNTWHEYVYLSLAHVGTGVGAVVVPLIAADVLGRGVADQDVAAETL